MATGIRGPRDRSRRKGAYAAGGGDGHRKRRGRLGWLAAARPTAARRRAAGPDRRRRRRQAASRAADSVRRHRNHARSRHGSRRCSLTARSESLLPVPAGGLAAYETETATGKEVTVQSVVVKDEGFWVGTSQRNRVYVEYGGDVGVNENQGVEPAVGDKGQPHRTGAYRAREPRADTQPPRPGCPAGHRAGRLHQRRQRGDHVDDRQWHETTTAGLSPATGAVPIIAAGPPASSRCSSARHRLHPPSRHAATSGNLLGTEVNGSSTLLFIAAGALLALGSPLQFAAKGTSLFRGPFPCHVAPTGLQITALERGIEPDLIG